MSSPFVHVVAGVLRSPHGRILVAQRRPGTHLAGLWEFPGGKLEAGEARFDALRRELHEEIGIVVEAAHPLITVPHRYPEKRIVLDVWDVVRHSGRPRACEGQSLAWIAPAALPELPMPEADRPVIAALRLPERYLITPALPADQADAVVGGVRRALESGIRLIQLRLPEWTRDRLAAIARTLRDQCRAAGARLLLHADWQLATVLGLDGVHLPARIAATLEHRPLPADKWVAVSCHRADELAHAERIGADFATLSPVRETASHPLGAPLGWQRFAALAQEFALPIYALGGLDGGDVEAARAAGGQGVAAIRGPLA